MRHPCSRLEYCSPQPKVRQKINNAVYHVTSKIYARVGQIKKGISTWDHGYIDEDHNVTVARASLKTDTRSTLVSMLNDKDVLDAFETGGILLTISAPMFSAIATASINMKTLTAPKS